MTSQDYHDTPGAETMRRILEALECDRPDCRCHTSAKSPTGGLTHCPAHPDFTPSFSVRPPDRSAWPLMHCFAGCPFASVLAALRERELLPRRTTFRVGRWEHRRDDLPDGRKVIGWDAGARPRSTLYRAEALDDLEDGATVLIAEGEKAAEAALALGLEAVATVCGASSIPDAEALEPLRRFDVVLAPDRDGPGRSHMQRLAQRLAELGIACRWLDVPDLPEKGDVADWRGGAERLGELVADAPAWEPAPVAAAEGAAPGAAEASIATFAPTDSGNGELLAHLFGDRLRYDHRRQRWLIWAGHHWRPDDLGQLVVMAKQTARRRYELAFDLPGGAIRDSHVKCALQSESASRIDGMLRLARSEPPLADRGDRWDGDPWLLGVSNGVVDLRSGELRAGRQSDMITAAIDCSYDPAATCPRWEQFLSEILGGGADLVQFVQRAIGYSLSGSTREQCLFILHGQGSNGKSVFLTTLRRLFGPLSANLAFSALERGMRSTGGFDLAPLAGKRLVTSSETNEGTRIDESRVKTLTGGDAVTASFKYENAFEFVPVSKIWVAVNHLPVVNDVTDSFWRRVRVIPFTQQFTGDAIDPDLETKLAGEVQGILTWAVKGALAWQQQRLNPPEIVTTAGQEYRLDSDTIAAFIEEECIVAPSYRARRGELFTAYLAWADANHLTPVERLGERTFGQRIGARFQGTRGTGGAYWYQGIGLKTGTHPPSKVNLLDPAERQNPADTAGSAAESEVTSLDFESGVNLLDPFQRVFSIRSRVEKFSEVGSIGSLGSLAPQEVSLCWRCRAPTEGPEKEYCPACDRQQVDTPRYTGSQQ